MPRLIRLFRWIRYMYRIIGVNFTSKSTPDSLAKWRKFTVFTSLVIMLTASNAFVLFKAETIAERATGFSTSALVTAILAFFIITMMKVSSLIELIRKFEVFIRKRAVNPDSKSIYRKFDRKFERFCKFAYIGIVYVSLGVGSTSLLLTSYINYYFLDMKDESFALTSPLMFPFDWQTPIGYLVAELLVTALYVPLLLCATATICFFTGSCWLFITFAKDITNDLTLLNICGASNQGRRQMRKYFGQIIQIHMDAKQLVDDFNDIYEFVIFGYFAWTFSGVCCFALTLLAQLSNNASPAEILTTLIQIAYTFVTLYAACEMGQRVAYQFNLFNEKVYDCDWYLFSLEMKRIYAIALIGSQDPVIIEGYANTVCTRNAFENTVNGGFSYLMMLRRIDG